MKVLLTGGAGYIGSHTAVEVINSGHDVIIADDFSNSKPEVLDRIEKITGVKPPLYKINVCDFEATDKMFEIEKPDAVIHFAGYKAVGESVAKPTMYYRNNLGSMLTVLECMKKHGTNKVIFSSSATVYGDPATLPITEDMPTGNCSNPYGRTKYMIEKILTDVAISDPDISVVLLRYFNPIGAHETGLLREEPNGIPNNLMPYVLQVADGIRDHLNVFGNDYDTHDGTGVRDYIHVVDLAIGHVRALEYSDKNKGVEVFNLGTGVGYSVLDIVNSFIKANGVDVPYVITERRPGDIAACYASPKKAKDVLGWVAERDIVKMCLDGWNAQKMKY